MIEVPQFARKGWVELAHYGSSGIASFDDITVKPAVWKETYPHWQIFFGMLWAAIMMWLLLNSHFWTMPWGKAVLASGILIIIGVTLPPATMFQVASSGAKLSQKVLHTAEEVFPVAELQPDIVNKPLPQDKPGTADSSASASAGPVEQHKAAGQKQVETARPERLVSSSEIQKLGHSLLFACLGYFAFMAFYQRVATGLLSYTLVLFAVSTEILQLVIDGRIFGAVDLGLDLLGIAIGALGAWLFCHVRPCK
jgi:hypothetical protein